jgi:predicted N-acetyltransferase YhbS
MGVYVEARGETHSPCIRAARPEEVDVVGDVLRAAYGGFERQFPADSWPHYLGEVVDVRRRLRDSDLIVADDAGHVVGTVCFYPNAERSTIEHWPPGWASIRALAVVPGAQRRGIGNALVSECLGRSRRLGVRAVGLHTNPFMVTATRLYEGLGFRRAPEFDIEIGEMFTGRRLRGAASWQAQGFWLDLREEQS